VGFEFFGDGFGDDFEFFHGVKFFEGSSMRRREIGFLARAVGNGVFIVFRDWPARSRRTQEV
jgi:hypothetical protein